MENFNNIKESEKKYSYEFYSNKETIEKFLETFDEESIKRFREIENLNPGLGEEHTNKFVNNELIEFWLEELKKRVKEGKSTYETVKMLEERIPDIIKQLEKIRKEVLLNQIKMGGLDKRGSSPSDLVVLGQSQIEMHVYEKIKEFAEKKVLHKIFNKMRVEDHNYEKQKNKENLGKVTTPTTSTIERIRKSILERLK